MIWGVFPQFLVQHPYLNKGFILNLWGWFTSLSTDLHRCVFGAQLSSHAQILAGNVETHGSRKTRWKQLIGRNFWKCLRIPEMMGRNEAKNIKKKTVTLENYDWKNRMDDMMIWQGWPRGKNWWLLVTSKTKKHNWHLSGFAGNQTAVSFTSRCYWRFSWVGWKRCHKKTLLQNYSNFYLGL